jgi:hypothetical protein
MYSSIRDANAWESGGVGFPNATGDGIVIAVTARNRAGKTHLERRS